MKARKQKVRKQESKKESKQARKQESKKASKHEACMQASKKASKQASQQPGKHLEGIQSELCPVGACFVGLRLVIPHLCKYDVYYAWQKSVTNVTFGWGRGV